MECPDNLDDGPLPGLTDDEDEIDERPKFPELISDGKRMRTVWQPHDGDGDPNLDLVERNMYLVRGHPTWKVFMDEVHLPIRRGGEEPPKYCYLDDRACHAIFYSDAYSKEERRDFWPWDYNHQGHIKQGRLNRGRPAYLDDSHTTFATAPLRGGKMYTFFGAPEETEYRPRRPVKPKEQAKEGDGAEKPAANKLASPEVNAPTTPDLNGKLTATPRTVSTTPEQGLRSLHSTPSRSFTASPRSTYEMSPAISPGAFSSNRKLDMSSAASTYNPMAAASPAKRKFPTTTELGSPTKRVQK